MVSLGRGLGSLIPARKAANLKTTLEIHPVSPSAPHTEGQIRHIPVTSIRPNPHQPRRAFSHEALEDLISSIKEHGLLQPITVSETVAGEYELISGERRLRAATMAGLVTIPAIVKKVTKEKEKLEWALIENIQRQDLNPIEEAFAFERLIDEFGLTQEEAARRVGKSRPHISNTLRLLSLPEEIQAALSSGQISMSTAKVLLGLKDAVAQLKMFKKLAAQGATVRDAEELVSSSLGKNKLTKRDPLVLDLEAKLRAALGTKARVTKRGSQGMIAIYYYSPEELTKLVKQITS